MDSITSSEIFRIAADVGIVTTLGGEDPIEDSSIADFTARYREWSTQRDRNLGRHLRFKPALFRVHLPFNQRVFRVACQVAWYLDEVIIRDPLESAISEDANIEEKKIRVRELVQFLAQFRRLIDSGYILLGGSDVLHDEEFPDLAQTVSSMPDVRQALHDATYCGYIERANDEGILIPMSQLRLDGSEVIKFGPMNLPARSSMTSPVLRVGETLPPIAAAELAARLGTDDLFKEFEGAFTTEVHRTLKVLARGARLETAILFDRQVDALVANAAGADLAGPSSARQNATVGALNLVLPYVEGIPPDQLVTLREKMPDAFIDFRSRLVEIIREAVKDGLSAEEIRSLGESRIQSQVMSLDTELQANLRKARILGLGLPLVAAVGTLGGAMLYGSEAASTTLPLAGGAAAALKAYADARHAKATITGRPFYFLWRARK